jgi:hypothetical protein
MERPRPPRGTTGLSDSEREELVARARQEPGGFVDPTRVRRVCSSPRSNLWRAEIIGRPWTGFSTITAAELVLLDLADAADPAPVHVDVASAEDDRRAALEECTSKREAWAAMAAEIEKRSGVRVVVRHNWTLRHHDGYVNGADHIVVDSPGEPLRSGRLTRHHNEALCQTPSRARDLRALDTVEDRAAQAEQRLPTCRSCLHVAERLAGQRTSGR